MTPNTETLLPQDVVEAGLAAVLASALNPDEKVAPIRLHPISIETLIMLNLIEFEKIDGMNVPTALGATLIADAAEPVITERDALMTRVLVRRGFLPAEYDTPPTAVEPGCSCPPGTCLDAPEEDTFEVHPATLKAMMRADLVDLVHTVDDTVPYYMGKRVVLNARLAPFTDADDIVEAAISAYVDGRGTIEPELIEGEAFEPYEIPVIDAQVAPVPSKRELLARVAGALQDQSYATTLLLEQIDLLEDAA